MTNTSPPRTSQFPIKLGGCVGSQMFIQNVAGATTILASESCSTRGKVPGCGIWPETAGSTLPADSLQAISVRFTNRCCWRQSNPYLPSVGTMLALSRADRRFFPSTRRRNSKGAIIPRHPSKMHCFPDIISSLGKQGPCNASIFKVPPNACGRKYRPGSDGPSLARSRGCPAASRPAGICAHGL